MDETSEIINQGNQVLSLLSSILKKLSSIEEKVGRLDSFILEVSPEEALLDSRSAQEELDDRMVI